MAQSPFLSRPLRSPGYVLTYLCITDMFLCMRTTIEINGELFALAKRYAVERKTSLKAVIESALCKSLPESG